MVVALPALLARLLPVAARQPWRRATHRLLRAVQFPRGVQFLETKTHTAGSSRSHSENDHLGRRRGGGHGGGAVSLPSNPPRARLGSERQAPALARRGGPRARGGRRTPVDPARGSGAHVRRQGALIAGLGRVACGGVRARQRARGPSAHRHSLLKVAVRARSSLCFRRVTASPWGQRVGARMAAFPRPGLRAAGGWRRSWQVCLHRPNHAYISPQRGG